MVQFLIKARLLVSKFYCAVVNCDEWQTTKALVNGDDNKTNSNCVRKIKLFLLWKKNSGDFFTIFE